MNGFQSFDLFGLVQQSLVVRQEVFEDEALLYRFQIGEETDWLRRIKELLYGLGCTESFKRIDRASGLHGEERI